MSCRDVREDSFASPLRARSLFTVRAAISLAFSVEAPSFLTLSLTCSYCRSRLSLQAFWGIRSLLGRVPRGCPGALFLCLLGFERRVLDVVLGRVLVHELVDHVGTLVVGVVDLDERLPFLGQCVLGKDRLDRTLRLAGAAIDALLRVDDQDALELVDAVDRADIHAGEVLDVDARLRDDVRHGGSVYSEPLVEVTMRRPVISRRGHRKRCLRQVT